MVNISESDYIRELQYNQAVISEKYSEPLEGECLAIHNMLEEIRQLGYDYHYFADIQYRDNKDVKVMEILVKYYPQMESIFTKNEIIVKISPDKFPEIRETALKEYLNLSSLDKMSITGFEKTLSKGKLGSEYENKLFDLLNDADIFATSCFIVKRLLKKNPLRMKQLLIKYSRGVLLYKVLEMLSAFNDEDAIQIIRNASMISEEEIKSLCNDSSYSLTVTMFEYWKKLCTVENIRGDARKLLKKMSVNYIN